MRIAWFSPLPPDRSEIANSTERLRDVLQKRFEMRFLAENGGGFFEPATQTLYHGGLGPCPHDLLVSLNAGDVPVYNLGNNPMFFAQTWFLSQFKPGIVILHDLKLHHFFEGIYRERLADEPRYLNVLQQEHGYRGREAGQAFARGRLSITYMAEFFPMTAWAVRNALGIVVHTPHAYEEVRKITSTPVWMLPLPYEPQVSRPFATDPSADTNERAAYSAENRVKIALFGYLNVNRRIVEFLHALATMEECDLFEVHIVGTMLHAEEVNAAVGILELRSQVTCHGYVSDEQLETLLGEADLAVNLRYPTMGEASASQLRIWEHALPSLVTHSDGYAYLPPESVFFVRPHCERLDIQQHLRGFLRRPHLAREKGRWARLWLLDHHKPGRYADGIATICEALGGLRSRHNRLGLAERVGRAISPWAATSGPPQEQHYATHVAGIV